jgi:hypothetical protein
VEFGFGVTIAVLASSELTEVPRRLRDNIVIKLEDDATGGLLVDSDVELDAR